MALKNITLSAEEQIIQAARKRATSEHSSLNAAFRDWLAQYAKNASEIAQERRGREFSTLINRLGEGIKINRSFTRDELNER